MSIEGIEGLSLCGGTTTGRLDCRKPNLNNFPTASTGMVLVAEGGECRWSDPRDLHPAPCVCVYCGRERNDSDKSCPGCAATETKQKEDPRKITDFYGRKPPEWPPGRDDLGRPLTKPVPPPDRDEFGRPFLSKEERAKKRMERLRWWLPTGRTTNTGPR